MTEIFTPPAHPGEALGEELFRRSMTHSDAARLLGLRRPVVSRLVNGLHALSATTAIRLERAGVGTAREWLSMQAEYDLYRFGLLDYSDVQPFPPRMSETVYGAES